MRRLKEILRKLSWVVGRSRFHAELADEMQFHIESRAEELEAAGMSRKEALGQARREFGSSLKAAEDTSAAWSFEWLRELGSDMRYAGRAFRRSPGFACVAVVCLAIGIGANTTIFNITSSFLFSEPSCADPKSMIAIWEGGDSAKPLSDYKFLREAGIFAGMAGINVEREVNWREGERTRRFYAGVVTDDFFTTTRPAFLMGRGIGRNEPDAAVISQQVWGSAFGSDPRIVGRKLILDGRMYSIAGVLPGDYRSIVGFGISPDVYIPVTREDDDVQIYARMPKGMTVAAARARVQIVFEQLDRIHPNNGWKRADGTRVMSVAGFDVLNQLMPGAVTAFFAMILIVFGLVLLIACTNVASLLLARAQTRSHELAVRRSLGASRRRIVRHLLAESLLLSILGAAVAFGINVAADAAVNRLSLPIPVPIRLVVAPDWRLLWYSLALVLVSALACGLLPALKAAGKDINQVLKQEERQTPRVWNLRSFLIAGQLAVSIVLLAAAFLFLHNLMRATAMNPGFNVNNTLWAYMRLVPDRYRDDPAKQNAVVDLALERLRALPGVESAAITSRVPLNDNCVTGATVKTDGWMPPAHMEWECNSVGPDYFRTLEIPILRGRDFLASDREGSQPVIIVNQAFAHSLLGDRDPIGQVIKTDLPGDPPKRIIGVAKDSKYFTLNERQRAAVYQPYFASHEPVNLHFLLRTAGPPSNYVRVVSETLGRIDRTAAIETKPMKRALRFALLPSQAAALLLGATGFLGLALAAIGLYGVLLYSVSRRSREIGLRVACGAAPADILRTVCAHTFTLAGSGAMAGLLLALFAVRPLALFLVPGLNSYDPTTLAAVVAVLIAVATVATIVPAVRALRLDPMTALRYE